MREKSTVVEETRPAQATLTFPDPRDKSLSVVMTGDTFTVALVAQAFRERDTFREALEKMPCACSRDFDAILHKCSRCEALGIDRGPVQIHKKKG